MFIRLQNRQSKFYWQMPSIALPDLEDVNLELETIITLDAEPVTFMRL